VSTGFDLSASLGWQLGVLHCGVVQCAVACGSVWLQCVAVCCSVLQCVVACCSVDRLRSECFQWAGDLVCRSLWQSVAVCCSVLHVCHNKLRHMQLIHIMDKVKDDGVLQHDAVCCNMLQSV